MRVKRCSFKRSLVNSEWRFFQVSAVRLIRMALSLQTWISILYCYSAVQTTTTKNLLQVLLNGAARAVYGKYSVNRSSYRPLVRVTEAFVQTTRTTARCRVSEDELFSGHRSCTRAVTNTKPMPISSTHRRVNVYSLSTEHHATCKRGRVQVELSSSTVARQHRLVTRHKQSSIVC